MVGVRVEVPRSNVSDTGVGSDSIRGKGGRLGGKRWGAREESASGLKDAARGEGRELWCDRWVSSERLMEWESRERVG